MKRLRLFAVILLALGSPAPRANPRTPPFYPDRQADPDHDRHGRRPGGLSLAVSTGATVYSTPPGTYKPFRMEAMHYSQEWDNAGMPNSIFFSSRGHAIHGSDHPGLGTPVSHGCVRLSLTNAATLYALVGARGIGRHDRHHQRARPAGYFAATQIPKRQPAPSAAPFQWLFGGFGRSR